MSQTRLRNTLLLASLSTLTLAACGGRSVDESKSAAPLPPIAEMDTAMAQPAPMPLSASDTLTPVMPPSAAPVTQASTFVPVETPPVAVAGTSSMEDRMAKLEQSVNSLRSDYDRIMPAFASLNTTNERIQTLLDEMEAQAQGVPAAADRADVTTTTTTVATKTTETPLIAAPTGAMKAAPTAQETIVDETQTTSTTITTATPVEKPAAAPAAKATPSTGNAVTAVRVGEHGSKTRVVFDLSGTAKPDFKYDLDNAEHLLLIDMPASSWAAKDKGAPNSPLIAGWSSQKGANGGSAVAIQLKKNARVLSTEFLKPEGSDPARLVMDIAAGG